MFDCVCMCCIINQIIYVKIFRNNVNFLPKTIFMIQGEFENTRKKKVTICKVILDFNMICTFYIHNYNPDLRVLHHLI